MIHSTSLRATGSEIWLSIWVAALAPELRTASIACLTKPISASEVSGVGAWASGTFEGEMRRTGGAAATCGAASPLDASGRARGNGTSFAAACLDDLSLCLVTFLPALAALAALAVVRDELIPLWEAVASAAAE